MTCDCGIAWIRGVSTAQPGARLRRHLLLFLGLCLLLELRLVLHLLLALCFSLLCSAPLRSPLLLSASLTSFGTAREWNPLNAPSDGSQR